MPEILYSFFGTLINLDIISRLPMSLFASLKYSDAFRVGLLLLWKNLVLFILIAVKDKINEKELLSYQPCVLY